ncbi:hypothetical protein [Burkholderia plantarii]|uniref:hypothetical protein n=1 Tax=Burkholderia plantarii TaxID=41899 RepID=UPI00114D1F9B|nr:hypothetical protein [Burkholderia plantarii]
MPCSFHNSGKRRVKPDAPARREHGIRLWFAVLTWNKTGAPGTRRIMSKCGAMSERAGVGPSIRDAAFAIDSIWQSNESFNRAGQLLQKKIGFFGLSAILGKETKGIGKRGGA